MQQRDRDNPDLPGLLARIKQEEDQDSKKTAITAQVTELLRGADEHLDEAQYVESTQKLEAALKLAPKNADVKKKLTRACRAWETEKAWRANQR